MEEWLTVLKLVVDLNAVLHLCVHRHVGGRELCGDDTPVAGNGDRDAAPAAAVHHKHFDVEEVIARVYFDAAAEHADAEELVDEVAESHARPQLPRLPPPPGLALGRARLELRARLRAQQKLQRDVPCGHTPVVGAEVRVAEADAHTAALLHLAAEGNTPG